MKAVVQRVRRAAVRIAGRTVGEINAGLLVLLGLGKDDTPADTDWMINKLLNLRIFPDDAGKMNRSVTETGGGLLVVSQFTLYGDVKKGYRPSFSDAMPPVDAERFYGEFLISLRAATTLPVAEGRFAAMMDVELVNDGPVTIVLESPTSLVGQASRLSPPKTQTGTGETPVPLFQPFDAQTPATISRRHLPHWQQPGCTYFVTFRLADSLPAEWLKQWHALQPKPEFPEQLHQWLDAGRGDCLLRRPEIAGIVESALQHFDGKRYALGEFVIMPNHVHALVTPLGENELPGILHAWKSFTAHEINRLLQRAGPVWQDETFDHLVRDEHALEKFTAYIRGNPQMAGLHQGEFRRGVGRASRLSPPSQTRQAGRLSH